MFELPLTYLRYPQQEEEANLSESESESESETESETETESSGSEGDLRNSSIAEEVEDTDDEEVGRWVDG